MYLSIANLCQLISNARCVRYNREGVPFPEPPYRKEYSLLPIVTIGHEAQPGATLWLLSTGDDERDAAHVVEAFQRGARFFVLEEKHLSFLQQLSPSERVGLEAVIVPNVIEAFYSTATLWRTQAIMPVVAITGSVGKSTTKAMLETIFTNDGVHVFAAPGTQTTVREVALNIFNLSSKHMTAIFEVGVSKAGEMARCMQLLQPTMALITAVDAEHLHDLGSIDAVAEEKLQIFSQFSPSQIGIICGDYPQLSRRFFSHPVARYGIKGRKNVVVAKKIRTVVCNNHGLATRFLLKLYDREAEITLPGNHIGVVYAALAASTVSYFLHTPFEVLTSGLEKFRPVAGRFQVLELAAGRGILVNDSGNSSPASVRAAVTAFHGMHNHDRKIAVLGPMRELGERSVYWHRQIGRDLYNARSITHLVLIATESHEIARTAPATMKVSYVDNWQQAEQVLTSLMTDEPSLVLAKGSEHDGLGILVDRIMKHS